LALVQHAACSAPQAGQLDAEHVVEPPVMHLLFMQVWPEGHT
jgi:hypothetical protein